MKKSTGVVGGHLLVGRSGALTSPPKIWPCCGAERVKKSNEQSIAVSAERGLKLSGAWAERERDSPRWSRAMSGKLCRSAHMLCRCMLRSLASALIRQTRQQGTQYVICYRCQRSTS